MLKFKDLCNELNVKLKENTSQDISDLNKKILSYNHSTNSNEYKKIIKLIRKKNENLVLFTTNNNNLECTLYHKFYTTNNKYESVADLLKKEYKNISILQKDGTLDNILNIKLTNKKIPIYDIEVEDNHNLFTNNLLSHNSMGDPTTVSGGKAIPFYAHCRIRITRSEIDRENMQNVMKFTIIKNKMAAPFKVGTVVYKWNEGFDFFSEIGQLAIEFNIIKNEKNSYFLPETDLKITGKKKVITHLKDNPEYTKAVLEPLVLNILEGKEIIESRLNEDNAKDLF